MAPATVQEAATGPFRWRVAPVIALAAAVRVLVWLALPGDRFASDEAAYYQAATSLLETGERNTFWPPLTTWLIAGAEWLLHTRSPKAIRLVWIGLDLWCLIGVRTLARRVAEAQFASSEITRERLVGAASVAYALYLPAVAYAQFTTSEVPALALVLAALVLLTRAGARWPEYVGAGVLLGAVAVARPSLLLLAIVVPAATAVYEPSRLGRALSSMAAGALVIGAVVLWNWYSIGELTLARNSSYNLYIGNQDFYAEDLDLFQPRATPEQIEFRRQFFAGTLAYPAMSSRELQREAFEWIGAHPWQFGRRALGRLARVFVPKTDVLELAGGEARAGIFSIRSLGLLAIANLEWGALLVGGLFGLLTIARRIRPLGLLLSSVLVASLPLCLVAISKPRYSFVFDPVLLIGAVVCAFEPRDAFTTTWQRHRIGIAIVLAALAWSWTAWLIFAFSSRLALAGA